MAQHPNKGEGTSVLQCVAVCCSVLQCVVVPVGGNSHVAWVAVFCSVLQCVAVCCRVLQCVVVPVGGNSHVACVAVCCRVLQCVTVCCRVLQSVAVCCSVLQCLAHHERDVCLENLHVICQKREGGGGGLSHALFISVTRLICIKS